MLNNEEIERRIDEIKSGLGLAKRTILLNSVYELYAITPNGEMMSENPLKKENTEKFAGEIKGMLEQAYRKLAISEAKMEVKTPDDQLFAAVENALKANKAKQEEKIERN